ncbi:general secretion pathway protein G [Caldanaerobius fijiensis DSM 17918]|uniref:General secretion pathway protein G n=1 Tax=Caldanaerobius fijiensis DSM 17918 TaxID=1121256 RepID=A0A1M5BJW3_9THEO|nr:type II secretion system protein GspG [Caldanaerobius fijiensis]SHF42893.1 general secretion pathway protein G [Caldanaerobius fijiensis DSM 17918]
MGKLFRRADTEKREVKDVERTWFGRMVKNVHNNKGFTLVELLVVVAIIAILAAVLVPRLLGYTDRARQARAMSDLGTMKTVIETYTADEGQGVYPSKDNTTDNYVGKVLKDGGINWTGGTDGIKDPWGHPYYYDLVKDSNGNVTGYIIISPGKDGQPNNSDDVYTTDSVQPTVGQPATTIDQTSAAASAQ